ncbi:Nif3-like dinuclear metal center hexameric protein [soil metagenome]
MPAAPETATVKDVVAVMDEAYDPAWAQPWDAVGLVCGDPAAPVRKVLLAVDPVAAVVEEAVDWGADLLITHHPLLLRAVHGVAATTPKGRVLHRLLTSSPPYGVALHVAHTNADSADPGVSDALARVLDLHELRPLDPAPADPLDKLVTFVPQEDAERLLDALAAAGAGAIGDYSRCAWTTEGTGTFLPGVGARPAIGAVGQVEQVAETRLEMVLPRGRRSAVVDALRSAHPYEEPAYDVTELASVPAGRGTGRVGELAQPEPLSAFVERAARALPATAAGLRAAGDPEAQVRTVAVCGGAGDSLLDVARASGADVYLTADLRHHPVSESREHGPPALVDAAHWATEWPWLHDVATLLGERLSARGTTVETRVSRIVTDPWTAYAASVTRSSR